MTQFLFTLSEWPDLWFILLSYLTVALGFLLSKMLFAHRAPMGRINFFLWFALLYLVFVVIDTGWLELDIAYRNGVLDGMILMLLLMPALHGVLLQRLCSARAADIWDKPQRDWIALIPFGLLVFIFAGGQKAEAAREAPYNRTKANLNVARDCALILISLGVLASGKAVEQRLEIAEPSAGMLAMWDELLQDQPLHAQLEAEVEATRPVLPFEIDPTTTLIAIRSDAERLVLTYRFSGDPAVLDAYFHRAIAATACSAEMYGSFLEMGVTLEYKYTGTANLPLKTFTVTEADCLSS